MLAYLRLIQNPADDISLSRIINVPKRAIGDSTVEQLTQYARQNDMSLYAAVAAPPDTLASRARKSVNDFSSLIVSLLLAKETLPLSEFVQKVIDDSGLIAQYQKEENEENQARIENIREFMGAVTEFEQKSEDKSLFAFLENVALVTELDNQDSAPSFVTMMTLHSAKGLEYDVVFMSGMEEGIFPSARAMQEDNRVEEERRLCYVGVTRARRLLHLSYARRRMLFNQMQFNAPSCFLQEIPKRLIREEQSSAAQSASYGYGAPAARGAGWGSYGGSGMRRQGGYQDNESRPQYGYGDTMPQRRAPAPKAPARPAQQPWNIPGVQRGFVPSPARSVQVQLFKVGDKVQHPKFGKGVIREVTGSGDAARLHIVFPVFGEKVLAQSIAPIVKIEE